MNSSSAKNENLNGINTSIPTYSSVEDGSTHYFDHATTSIPKAPGIAQACFDYYHEVCASPSRSGHKFGIIADSILARARVEACEFFHARSPNHIVFTSGATESLNLVLHSMLEPGDQVVATSFDHNATIRPINKLSRAGVQVKRISCGHSLLEFVTELKSAVNTQTKLMVITQASNVDGTVLPVGDIVRHAHRLGVPVLVDGAQSAGWLDRQSLCEDVDFFAASMHKGLLGPFGLGVLVVGTDDAELQPLKHGGTGFETLSTNPRSPIPEGLETGTINAPAIAAAIPAFKYVQSSTYEHQSKEVLAMFRNLLGELAKFENIQTLQPISADSVIPIVSLRHKRLSTQVLATALDHSHGVLTRFGLHCSPLRHRDLGTLPDGTVRVSLGHTTSPNDISALLAGLGMLDGRS